MPDTLIVLIGPTGVGKTELSLSIAEHFRTSIVSADSRQLYADLKIGTAAPTPKQLARVPHYFVGTLQLTDYYSAAQYEADVLAQLEILYQNHDTVILTGGSMMYIDAICKGIDDIPTVDNETRQLMLRRYEQEGLDTLCAELRLLDPEYYKIVDLKNPKRSNTCIGNMLHDWKNLYFFSYPHSQGTPFPHHQNRINPRPRRIV